MTKVKICGIKTLSDALTAVQVGADLLGFNFYSKSIRFVDPQTCAAITSVLRKEYPSLQFVGVFVNASVDEIKMIMETCCLDLAQLHGDESPEMLDALDGKAFKALRKAADLEMDKWIRRDGAPAFLVDADVKDVYGGTGIKADWSVATKLAKRYPFLLAGGLKPENVADAVRQVKPWGVDVASGVESGPGEKDAQKISAFVKAVRQVEYQI